MNCWNKNLGWEGRGREGQNYCAIRFTFCWGAFVPRWLVCKWDLVSEGVWVRKPAPSVPGFASLDESFCASVWSSVKWSPSYQFHRVLKWKASSLFRVHRTTVIRSHYCLPSPFPTSPHSHNPATRPKGTHWVTDLISGTTWAEFQTSWVPDLC